MEHINRIKSDKGNKQTNICLCEFAASYISLSRQNFINLKSTQQTMIVEKQKLGMCTVLPTSHNLRCEKRSTFYYACIDNSFELMLYDVDKHQVLINLFAKTWYHWLSGYPTHQTGSKEGSCSNTGSNAIGKLHVSLRIIHPWLRYASS